MDCQQQIVNAVLWTLEIEVAVAVVGIMLYKIWEAFQNIEHKHDTLFAYINETREHIRNCAHRKEFEMKTDELYRKINDLAHRAQTLEMLRIDDMAGKTTATVIPSPKRRRR